MARAMRSPPHGHSSHPRVRVSLSLSALSVGCGSSSSSSDVADARSDNSVVNQPDADIDASSQSDGALPPEGGDASPIDAGHGGDEGGLCADDAGIFHASPGMCNGAPCAPGCACIVDNNRRDVACFCRGASNPAGGLTCVTPTCGSISARLGALLRTWGAASLQKGGTRARRTQARSVPTTPASSRPRRARAGARAARRAARAWAKETVRRRAFARRRTTTRARASRLRAGRSSASPDAPVRTPPQGPAAARERVACLDAGEHGDNAVERRVGALALKCPRQHGFQRSGSRSSMREAGCDCTRVSTSSRYARALTP